MGAQSSRIIWGKQKTDGSEQCPIELYDPEGTLYVSGNYAIKNDTRPGKDPIAEDYHLYLCTAEQTGGDFVDEDWKVEEGVKNYYLISRKSFKKGARVIKEDTNGDFETMKLYKCIVDHTTPNRWVSSEWEEQYQDVAITWRVVDHKDIYYDDGRNNIKWHRKMYYVPPEYDDSKIDIEITEYSNTWQYHKDDRVLYERQYYSHTDLGCYKYIRNVPYKGEWYSNYWELEPDVQPYEAHVAYSKNDEVIKKTIDSAILYITDYETMVNECVFTTGKYCVHKIDKQYDVPVPGDGFADVSYLERILAGEELYGLYKCLTPTSGNFDPSAWELQASTVVPIRGRDYNPNRHDIKEWGYGQSFQINDLCIYKILEDSDILGLSVCKKDIVSSTKQNCPPNDEYWEPVGQYMEKPLANRVYRAVRDISASDNQSWQPNNWAIVTQNVEPDYDLYGIVWEKLDDGTGGGLPFQAPIIIHARKLYTQSSDYDAFYFKYCLDSFFPSLDEPRLCINGNYTGFSKEGDVSDNYIIDKGANLLVRCGFLYFGIWVGDSIYSVSNTNREYATGIHYSRYLLTSYDTDDINFIETTELQDFEFGNRTSIPFMSGNSGILYFSKNNGEDCIRKAVIGPEGDNLVSDVLMYTIDSSNNYSLFNTHLQIVGRYNNYGIYNHIFYKRTVPLTRINLLTFELEYNDVCEMIYSRNSDNYEKFLGCILTDNWIDYYKLNQLDPDSIFRIIHDDISFTDTTYQYSQYDSPLSPSEAAANIALIGDLYGFPYTYDTITIKEFDGSYGYKTRYFTTPDATNEILYQIEILTGININSGGNIAFRIMQLRKHSSYNTSLITIFDQRINIGNSQTWPSAFDQNYITYPWFDIEDLYYINMGYAYFMEHNNTSDNYGYWKLNLDDGTYRKLPNIGRVFGRINDIKPYDNMSIYLANIGARVENLNIIFCKSLISGQTMGLDYENNEITLYVDPTYFVNAAYGATTSGRPVGSINTSLVISDSIELIKDGSHFDTYGIVIYIPQFNGDNIEEANAFFFLNSETDNGGPFFGGASTPGF